MSSDGEAPATDLDRIRADIERERAQLAETVDALSDRVNVKARAQRKVGETRAAAVDRLSQVRAGATQGVSRLQGAATTDEGRPTSQAMAAGAVLVLVVAGVVTLVVRRRR